MDEEEDGVDYNYFWTDREKEGLLLSGKDYGMHLLMCCLLTL